MSTKKWFAYVPAPYFMAGPHWFRTKHGANEFAVRWTEAEEKRSGKLVAVTVGKREHYYAFKASLDKRQVA